MACWPKEAGDPAFQAKFKSGENMGLQRVDSSNPFCNHNCLSPGVMKYTIAENQAQ